MIKKESLFTSIVISALIYMFFMWGALSVQLKVFPYGLMERSLIGMSALFYNVLDPDPALTVSGYNRPIFKEYYGRSGVTHATDSAEEFYVLYSNSADHIVRLIDRTGQELHRWDTDPIGKLKKPNYILQDIQPQSIETRDVVLQENGDLLVVFEVINQFHNNYGVVKYNKDSDVVWYHQGRNHHYLDVAPNGDIYTLSLDVLTGRFPYDSLKQIHPPSFEDYIEVLGDDGTLKKRVSIIGAINNSQYGSVFLETLYNSNGKGDYLHPNTAYYITKNDALSSPLFKEGQVLVSLRNVDTIVAIDLEKEQAVWLSKGPWVGQHDSKLMNDGRIALFDNMGAQALKKSRILSFDMLKNDYRVLYEGNEKHPFYSPFCSAFEILESGNIFIVSHHNGRMFEVRENGEIIWEYFIPIDDPKDKNKSAGVYSGKRYLHADLPFLFEKE
jgi:hypothetical protein